ncbi:GGDEF domain-containing protein [Undibacterium sp. CY18W]|uniref:diguanylate cyclase n=1 Tax=Undibacterium hunanense TaxID=2762292 RepID=A0ABR6ZX22_9BURK|nr:GGDEF domain-containing protein [Undibacterium hunanense]MBC3920404.1 GGDEF domain-containing protein [Undibacterium hunanense]
MPTKRTGIRRGLDLVLGTGKAMRIRTSQFVLAALLMLASMGVLFFMKAVGIAGMGDVTIWASCCTTGLVIVYVLIRSGYSMRWADPSMAFVQMLSAIACNAAAFALAGDGRGVTLPLLAVILMFGMFGLSIRQVVTVAVYGLVLFGAAILFALQHEGGNDAASLYGAYFFMVVIVLASSTFLTWRLREMREHMRHQKQQLTQALEKIQLTANHDELTGTANRRYMLELIQRETQRTNRTSHPLLVAMLDIDYFKRVNDAYGHQAGDMALQKFTQTVQANIRTTDTLARWGGEEFLVLLTETELDVGLICLERVRAAVAADVIIFAGSHINFTVSIGVAQYKVGEPFEKTVTRADEALYAAKAQGRNQICLSGMEKV